MTATTCYRIATALFVVFALGHTVGFLRFVPPTPEGIAVRDAMNTVTFGSSHMSYGGAYRGFGLYITLYLVFSALLVWHLGQLARTAPGAVGPLGWGIAFVQLVGLVVSWKYFSPPPTVFSAVLAVLLAGAAWLVRPTPIKGF